MSRTRNPLIATGVGWLVLFGSCVATARADCLDDAAARFSVDTKLVHAIAQHESGMKPWVVNRNTDGKVDLGLMQINSRWLPTLSKYGVTADTLLSDACVNATVGVWILSGNIARYGATWKAVGAYNASSVDRQRKYVSQIYALWRSMN